MNTKFLFEIMILFQFRNVFGWKYQVLPMKAKSESLTDNIQLNISITETGGLSLYIDVKEDLPRDIYTTIHLAANGNTTDEHDLYDLNLIKRTVNCCKFFDEPEYEPELQLLFKTILDDGHFPTECPIKKGLYYIVDSKVSPDRLPLMMPESKAFLAIKHSVKERNKFKALADYQVYFTIRIANYTSGRNLTD